MAIKEDTEPAILRVAIRSKSLDAENITMHTKRITPLAALALLFTLNASADLPGDLGLTGPSTVLVGASPEYKLVFTLYGSETFKKPQAWIRNPAGAWTESTASATTVKNPDQSRTTTVKKRVQFTTRGSWRVILAAETWIGATPGEGRFGSKDVMALTLPL